jgi:hypothetical protein
MPDRHFIETYPLYRRLKVAEFPSRQFPYAGPTVHMYCPVCRSAQTFGDDSSRFVGLAVGQQDDIFCLIYNCAGCQRFHRYFLLRLDRKSGQVCKVGQEPPWEISLDPDLEGTLGQRADYFKKALVCESQNYGIGAFAYYRRIVEDVIDELLDSIVDLLADDTRDEYLRALQLTKKTTVAQEKIDLVKDLLPPILRPSGINPLGTLHSALSKGLHSMTDDDCMGSAVETKEALLFLVQQVSASRRSAAKFTENIRALLERRSKRE